MTLSHVDIHTAAARSFGAYSSPLAVSLSYEGATQAVITFVGSRTDNDWIDVNLKTKLVTWRHPNVPETVNVHEGFARRCDNLGRQVGELFWGIPKGKKIIFTGHSLGGAMALMWGALFKAANPQFDIQIITFGQPRVGGHRFKKWVESVGAPLQRVVIERDPVPRVPGWWTYDHVGPRLFLNDNGAEMGRVRGGIEQIRFWLGWDFGERRDHNAKRYLIAVEKWADAQEDKFREGQ